MIFTTVVWGNWSRGEVSVSGDNNQKKPSEEVLAADLGGAVDSSKENLEITEQVLDNQSIQDYSGAIARGDEIGVHPNFYREEQVALPEIEATEAAIIDLQNGLSYFEINGSGRWPLASLAKIVTAVVAIQKMDLNREIVISEEDLIFSSEEGQKLKAGDRYQLRDLISVMIAVSCNEAAEAIANAFGRAKFIEAMNDLASEWGLSSSYFKDPVGISISNQSTIKDIYKLVKKVLSDYPEIFKFSRQTRATIKELNSGKIFRYDSNNLFAGRIDQALQILIFLSFSNYYLTLIRISRIQQALEFIKQVIQQGRRTPFSRLAGNQ